MGLIGISVLWRGSGAGKEDSPASMLLIQGDADETMELVRAHENDGVASCAVEITTCERSGDLNGCEKGVQHCSVEQVVDIPLSVVQEEAVHFSVVVQETSNQKYFIEECVDIPGKQEVIQSMHAPVVRMMDRGLYNHVKAVVTSFSACEVEDGAITFDATISACESDVITFDATVRACDTNVITCGAAVGYAGSKGFVADAYSALSEAGSVGTCANALGALADDAMAMSPMGTRDFFDWGALPGTDLSTFKAEINACEEEDNIMISNASINACEFFISCGDLKMMSVLVMQ